MPKCIAIFFFTGAHEQCLCFGSCGGVGESEVGWGGGMWGVPPFLPTVSIMAFVVLGRFPWSNHTAWWR